MTGTLLVARHGAGYIVLSPNATLAPEVFRRLVIRRFWRIAGSLLRGEVL